MRVPRLLVLSVVTAGIAACGGPQIKDHDVDLAAHSPAALEAERPREGDPHVLSLRVYADPGVRALPKWKEEIADQIDYASQLLTPLLGVRLQIAETKEWARAGDPAIALQQLTELDKGDDVTWVVGYVSPSDTATKVMADLGAAQPLGKHIVMRGWSETAETKALASTLPDLKEAERAQIFDAHRRHKQTVVLLHYLAITLGAIDETDPSWIAHPAYDRKQHGFSERSRELMTIVADARAAQLPDVEIAKRLLETVEKSEWGGWMAAAKSERVSLLRAITEAGKAGKVASDIPAAALDQVSRIKELARQGQRDTALAELDNLIAAYPGTASIHQLKCDLMLAQPGVKDDKARAACKRVSELAPGDPNVHIAVGEALAKAGDLTAARAELVLAEPKIANLADADASQAAWRRLIGLYHGLGALTWTDDAIAKAKLTGDPVATAVAQTRARYGIPRGSRFAAPEQEAALVAAIKQALELVYASKYGDAEKVLAQSEKQWPGAPGIAAARCDLYLRKGAVDTAKAACSKALTADPNESWALYLMGVIALKNASGTNQGIAHLKRAIEVDPDLGQAWRTLGKAYTRAKDKASFDALAAEYQKKFGQALPP